MKDYIISKYGGRNTKIYIHHFPEIVSNFMRETNNFFEIQFLDFIKKNYPKHDEIIDIGANIGNHTLFFAEFLECKKIHSFEPVATNMNILRKNIENYKDKCICYDIALSNKCGHFSLYNSQTDNYGGFSLHSYSNGTSLLIDENIEVATLDRFNLKNISMIKIDVENHENEVLEGAINTILENKPIIFVENLHHGFPLVCPEPEPHQKILRQLNYTKKYSNICQSYMDLWVPD